MRLQRGGCFSSGKRDLHAPHSPHFGIICLLFLCLHYYIPHLPPFDPIPSNVSSVSPPRSLPVSPVFPPSSGESVRPACDSGPPASCPLPPLRQAGLLRKALARHAAISKDAKMGQGIDRHLFALHKLGLQGGRPHPLFEDAAYGALKADMLSTSSLYSDALMLGGFGPVSSGVHWVARAWLVVQVRPVLRGACQGGWGGCRVAGPCPRR